MIRIKTDHKGWRETNCNESINYHFPSTPTNQTKTTSFIRASPDEDLGSSTSDIGFTVSVSKPLGVVFSENPDPYLGLVIDDVAPGLNGGVAGMRVGDNLVAVNGEVVIGKYFDTAMDLLR